MAIVDSLPDAERLARAIASDLAIYNQETMAGLEQPEQVFDALATEIQEGRELFERRVSTDLHAVYGRILEEVLVPGARDQIREAAPEPTEFSGYRKSPRAPAPPTPPPTEPHSASPNGAAGSHTPGRPPSPGGTAGFHTNPTPVRPAAGGASSTGLLLLAVAVLALALAAYLVLS